MVCKKCGYSALIQNGDWLKCPNCGAEYFNTKIDFGVSARDESDLNDNSQNETANKESIDNSELNFDINEKDTANALEEPAQTEKAETLESSKESKKEKEVAKSSKKKKNKDENPKTPKQKKEKKEKEKNKKTKKEKQVEEDSNEESEVKQKSKFKDILDFITPIVIAVIVALLLKTFVFANAVVPTGSMIGTIHEGDRIIASRLSYIREDPERYDIIIFNYPDDESVIYVKRIIGLPGDTVSVVNGVTYIQDKEGNVYQTDDSFITEGKPVGDFGPYYIPDKGELITTDNNYCYAENGMVVGDIEFLDKYCEKDKSGNFVVDENGNYIVAGNCYFCMGDNRNYSLDSRYWNNKYVSENKILGKVLFRYYPGIEQLK